MTVRISFQVWNPTFYFSKVSRTPTSSLVFKSPATVERPHRHMYLTRHIHMSVMV